MATTSTNYQQIRVANDTTTDPRRMEYMAKGSATNTILRKAIVIISSFRPVDT